jgi:acyl-CoA thioester hydrolase
VVRPQWIDHNQHMNMGYYLVVFDLATDEFLQWVGLDGAHRRARQVSTFCLEAHITYHREVRAGDPLRFTTRLLAYDPKRIHYFHELYAAHQTLPRPPQVGRVMGLANRPGVRDPGP